ncbi:MAG: MoaD/ThiS family protein [Bacteroidetes bacterium]|jgi:molybdopterin converting factor small subunit|nr:MoaD/ThiS family protein [Bacteroidota bacterium]MBX7130180.1 MoaD/ThiS family protein [Flavobacteriales bacterium]MCC6655219.1 MoaD/ThiS family protein [Flavobacteriales bacterium]HMU12434.1 MoaD/ThiS family protein [Flavobacteriales bacterium]HNA31567.1 MoaD/ThiS family protein [Flavobacteriales bacterium]
MRVHLFGLIAERAGTNLLDVEATTVDELRRVLTGRIEGLDRLSYAIAVDRRLVKADMPLTGEEEVALLPPFAGG